MSKMYCNFTETQLRWLQSKPSCVHARIDQWNHFPTIRTPDGEVSWIGSFESLSDYLSATWCCPVCHEYENAEEDLGPVRCADCDMLVCDECIRGYGKMMVCDRCAFLDDLLNPVQPNPLSKEAAK